jgi:hypothetical protein
MPYAEDATAGELVAETKPRGSSRRTTPWVEITKTEVAPKSDSQFSVGKKSGTKSGDRPRSGIRESAFTNRELRIGKHELRYTKWSSHIVLRVEAPTIGARSRAVRAVERARQGRGADHRRRSRSGAHRQRAGPSWRPCVSCHRWRLSAGQCRPAAPVRGKRRRNGRRQRAP